MPNNEFNNFGNNIENGTSQMPVNNVETGGVQVQQSNMEIPQMNNVNVQSENVNETVNNQVVHQKEEGGLTAKVIPIIIFNALLIFGIFYATVNKNVLISAGSLIYIVLGTMIFAFKDKKKSEFPVSVIMGGMLAAVVCFVISMLREESMDLWSYYASACAIAGILGMIVSNIITKILTDIKNVKALQTITYLLFIAGLIVGPYFAYKKWPTEFYQIVFYQQNEVVAETYEEYVLKTLKARYSVNFECKFDKKHNYKTEKNEIMSTIPCIDQNKNEVNVRTIPFNEAEKQYTVIDDFMETIYFKEIKQMISDKVKEATGAADVVTYLYPKSGCIFVGDCADCEDYYKDYSKVNDPKNRYEISTSINLSKYINLSNEEFINKYINENEFKVILLLKGKYDKSYTDFNPIISKALSSLNTTGLKNTYGYEITFYDYEPGKYESKEYTSLGQTNDTKEFK